MLSIEISAQYFKEIIFKAGYPVVTLDQFELSEDDIKQMCILPAMREYYIWFPKELRAEYSASTTFSIPFPNERVFQVKDARINTMNYSGEGRTQSPFLNAVNFLPAMGNRLQPYDSLYDYNMGLASLTEKAELRSTIEMQKTVSIHTDVNNRVLEGYTNTPGKLTVTWAMWDENFEHIPFVRLPDVLKLCSANFLEFLGDVRGQLNTNSEVEFNFADMQDKAEAYRKDVMDVWKNFTRPVVIRG